jgi:hypothetical protein
MFTVNINLYTDLVEIIVKLRVISISITSSLSYGEIRIIHKLSILTDLRSVSYKEMGLG